MAKASVVREGSDLLSFSQVLGHQLVNQIPRIHNKKLQQLDEVRSL